MAEKKAAMWLEAILAFSLLTHAFGNLECEELPAEDCAFAVSSSGARCVLEKRVDIKGKTHYQCQTSLITADKNYEYIETTECIQSCGLERITIGLSTDILLEKDFTEWLCSPECRNDCPNIFDLYVKLAAGDGIYLPHVCQLQRPAKPRRMLADPIVTNKAVQAAMQKANPPQFGLPPQFQEPNPQIPPSAVPPNPNRNLTNSSTAKPTAGPTPSYKSGSFSTQSIYSAAAPSYGDIPESASSPAPDYYLNVEQHEGWMQTPTQAPAPDYEYHGGELAYPPVLQRSAPTPAPEILYASELEHDEFDFSMYREIWW